MDAHGSPPCRDRLTSVPWKQRTGVIVRPSQSGFLSFFFFFKILFIYLREKA